jgi:hypothetical protein
MHKVLLMSLFVVLVTTSRAQSFKVKDNSRLAKFVGRLSGQEDKYAITFGKTIFVSCAREDFLAEHWWVRHEVTHIQQYKKYGVAGFLERYVVSSIFHSYREIPFEKEAISAEEENP